MDDIWQTVNIQTFARIFQKKSKEQLPEELGGGRVKLSPRMKKEWMCESRPR